MIMYKLIKPSIAFDIQILQRLSNMASIPFDPANTDYQNFKKEVLAGAELQDTDGNTMTASESQEYVATLP
jgi:hypothetical protein